MAWNEPGDNNKDKDPWSGGDKPSGPPDLDEAVRKLQKKLRSVFSGGNGGDGDSGQAGKGASYGLTFVLVAILLIWFISGIFIVGPAEQAVILRLGKYTTTLGPGPHWIPRFIDSKYVVNVAKVSNFSYSSSMLTKDENIVSVSLAVQYRIDNTEDYLFKVVNPRESLQQATASALRQVIGHTTLDDILTTGREVVRQDVKKQLIAIMTMYKTGIQITDVAMQPAKAPEEVKAAFDDAIKAQEDEQRFINQAQAYARGVEPIAEGQAQRILAEANAYKQQVSLQAEGSVSQFLAILPEYLKQPRVTRERLYIDAVESVLMKTSKILVDVKGGNNMFYLPLDKLLQHSQSNDTSVITSTSAYNLRNKTSQQVDASTSSSTTSARPSLARSGRDNYRGRGVY